MERHRFGRALARLGLAVFLVCGSAVVQAQVSFSSSGLGGASVNNPTSLQFGPDGRLYVSQQNGLLHAYTISRTGPNAYSVTATESINEIQTIPNHDDSGNPIGQANRQVTGLMTAGTATNPVLYVTSSDPRIGAGGGGNDLNLDTNSGILTRLTWTGSSWDRVHLVRGFPRSEENHASNGMDLDTATGTLYMMSGGHTNMGGLSNNFAQTQEYALSAAMLSIDLTAIEAMPTLVDGAGQSYKYDLPTLDDPTRAGNPDANDPFGGNDGRNQAIIVPGGPVQVYAPGFRNAYDVVLTQAGKLYTVDNGPNGGWGGLPVGEGTPTCTNDTNETGSATYGDGLHYVSGPGYYGGHPHPTRANPETSGLYIYENIGGTWTLTEQYDWQTDFPVPPVPLGTGNSIECDYQQPGVDDNALAVIGASTNGITEYTASNFAGEMQGDLLSASFNGNIYRFQLNASGDDLAVPETAEFSGFGGQPLDVTAQGDGDPFPGTVWAAVYGADSIVVFEPQDFNNCSGADDPLLDEDFDGFDNADEIDNGTDPCSGGSKPRDNDGDFESDLNDDDDDNDTILDVDDAFAIDADNGLTTLLPVRYPFFNADPGSGFFGLGFTGLMINGSTDYLDQFDDTMLAAGGAAGLFTVEAATAGDALGSSNDQDNAFQLGVAVDADSGVFSVQTRLLSPYFQVGGSPSTPIDDQSYGLFIGTGDQDNYVKLVMNAQGGAGGMEVTYESGGTVSSSVDYGTGVVGDVLGSIFIDLYFTIDPLALTVQPTISVDSGALIDLGSPLPIPAAWLDTMDAKGLAVGLISTSVGSGVPFGATWDLLEVTAGQAGIECVVDVDCDDSDVCTVESCNQGFCESWGASSSVTCEADGNLCTLDSCDGMGTCVTDGPLVCPPFQTCSAGACIPSPSDGDNDGIDDANDPCLGDPRNLCFGGVAFDGTASQDIRINTSSGVSGSGSQVDCNGDTWVADFGFNTGSSAQCNLGGGCPMAGLDAIFGPGCDGHAATTSIFQSERYNGNPSPPLVYDFDVPDGNYVVNMLFANSWTGSVNPGERIFDIFVEGQLIYDDFDTVVDAGGSGVAVVRSALADVSGGGGLQIEFQHVVQNPAIKGLEVLTCSVASPTNESYLTLTKQPGGSVLNWTPAAGAFQHDVVRGDVAALQSAGGDFTAATTDCPASAIPGTAMLETAVPAIGEVWWYAVRGTNCAGDGSYDPVAPAQQGSRDAEIDMAPGACP